MNDPFLSLSFLLSFFTFLFLSLASIFTLLFRFHLFAITHSCHEVKLNTNHSFYNFLAFSLPFPILAILLPTFPSPLLFFFLFIYIFQSTLVFVFYFVLCRAVFHWCTCFFHHFYPVGVSRRKRWVGASLPPYYPLHRICIFLGCVM